MSIRSKHTQAHKGIIAHTHTRTHTHTHTKLNFFAAIVGTEEKLNAFDSSKKKVDYA